MGEVIIQVQLLEDGAKAPVVATPGEDLGYDIFALEDVTLFGYSTEPTIVRTGIAVGAYKGVLHTVSAGNTIRAQYYEPGEPLGLLIRDRSSMAAKGITTSGGVIDAGYRGEIKVLMSAKRQYQIKAGDKIAQMVPILVLTGKVKICDTLTEASRGTKGFGSSGR